MRQTSMKQQICYTLCLMLFVLGQNDLGHGNNKPRSKPIMPLISYCDLVKNPEKYDGKEVSVRATYRYGFEWQELFCLDCRKTAKTWLEFDNDDTQYKASLKKFPKNQGTISAIFTGTFHSSKGPYGDGGYRFQFMVTVISDVEVVSKQGWDPEHLTPIERKKACALCSLTSSELHFSTRLPVAKIGSDL